MKYTSDAARLCATHISNDRPAPQDADNTAEQEAYAGRVIAENLVTHYGEDKERINNAYWKLRRAMCDKVQGGDEILSNAELFWKLAADANLTHTGDTYLDGFLAGKHTAYKTAAFHMAKHFEILYQKAVSA